MSDFDELIVAYRLGYQAGKEGKPFHDNPYDNGLLYTEWSIGWHKGSK